MAFEAAPWPLHAINRLAAGRQLGRSRAILAPANLENVMLAVCQHVTAVAMTVAYPMLSLNWLTVSSPMLAVAGKADMASSGRYVIFWTPSRTSAR